MDGYITAKEAAKMLSVSAATIRTWCKEGLLDHFTVKRSRNTLLRISKQSCESFPERMGGLHPAKVIKRNAATVAPKRKPGRPAKLDLSDYPHLQ